MPLPTTPLEFKNLIISPTATFCQAFVKLFLQLPTLVYKAANFVLTSTGNLTDDFLRLVFGSGHIKWTAGGLPSWQSTYWLRCDGASYNRTDYPDLYNAIGTVYGDGSNPGTTFAVPNLSGTVVVGSGTTLMADATTGTTYTVGQKVGKETVILLMTNLPAFPPPLGTNVDDVMLRRITGAGAIVPTAAASAFDVFNNSNVDGSGDPDEAANLNSNLGDDEPHENRQPTLAVNCWIKT